ncbi:hypothetical protein HKI87_01g05010 [Chloropicon roscoffensis]|uniref:Uncharacterized protein n=1 Tax=Chloropicon roscoffensis TaxID=1461544 RepID=A0AAX4NYM8_9CHLO
MSSVYDSFGTEIARSFKDFRMATPKSARKPFRDATNTMSSRPIDVEEPSWSTGRPKKRMKGGQRVDLGNSIRTPTESSVLLERLSKTIDVGVNEVSTREEGTTTQPPKWRTDR